MDSQGFQKDNKVARRPSLTLKDVFTESNDQSKKDKHRGSSSALGDSRSGKNLNDCSQSSFGHDIRRSLAMKKSLSDREVRFSDDVQIQEIAKYSSSVLDDLFYDDDQLSNFRYEAFMEKCGLDPESYH